MRVIALNRFGRLSVTTITAPSVVTSICAMLKSLSFVSSYLGR